MNAYTGIILSTGLFLTSSRKGIADEELAKKERERAQTQVSDRRQRSTSVASSSMSSQSVSSYSTNKSDSQTKMARPNHSLRKVLDDRPQKSRSSYGHKRRRSSSPAEDRGRDSSDSDRRTRRRFSDASPESRGRRRSVDHVSRRTARQGSRSPVRGGNQRFRRGEEHEQHSEYVPPKQPNIQSGQEHVEKTERKCSSPAGRVARDDRGRRQSHDDGESGGMYRSSDNHRRIASPAAPRPPQPPRERSLSPFSKRVALTRKLNGGS